MSTAMLISTANTPKQFSFVTPLHIDTSIQCRPAKVIPAEHTASITH